MTVQAVSQMWSRTGAKATSGKYDPFPTEWSHTTAFQVVHEVGDDEETIAGAAELPNYGDRHPTGVDSFLRSKQLTQISPILSVVECGYEGKAFDAGVDIEWSDTNSTEPIDRDFNGVAILTENGEPVDGLTMDIADPVVVIRRKFFTIDQYAIGAYRHATNSDPFLGWPPGTARLVAFSAKNQFKRGAPEEQWDVTARIQFRYPLAGATAAQAWYKRWRHEGLYVKVNGVVRRALDPFGQEVTKPVLLKADGTQETDPNAALFKYTKVYGSLPYSALGLV